MRALFLGAALGLAACSGLPPDTTAPLQGGETAVGLNVSADLFHLHSPDVNVWMGVGLGRGVDLAVGADVPFAFMLAGPYATRLPLRGAFPGLALRKTFENGVGLGVGTSSRIDVSPDTTSRLPHYSTAGAFVTLAASPEAPVARRATLHLGYAEVVPAMGRPTRRGLALHGGVAAGPTIAMADTARAVLAGRLQAGVLVWPRLERFQGLAVGFTPQLVDVPSAE